MRASRRPCEYSWFLPSFDNTPPRIRQGRQHRLLQITAGTNLVMGTSWPTFWDLCISIHTYIKTQQPGIQIASTAAKKAQAATNFSHGVLVDIHVQAYALPSWKLKSCVPASCFRLTSALWISRETRTPPRRCHDRIQTTSTAESQAT